MTVTLLMLPPQTETTRDWARRLASALPELSVVVAEDVGAAARAVGLAEAAYGTMPRTLLREAARLLTLTLFPSGGRGDRHDSLSLGEGEGWGEGGRVFARSPGEPAGPRIRGAGKRP
jgi:hypothetical protein